MRRIRLLAFGMALLQTGCSFIFVKGPQPSQQNFAPDERPVGRRCTRSYTAPVLDTIWGGLHVLSLAMLGTTSDTSKTAGYSRDNMVAMETLWLTLAVSSAVWGYSKVSDCLDVTGPDEDGGSWGSIGQRPVASPPPSPPPRQGNLPPGFIPMGR